MKRFALFTSLLTLAVLINSCDKTDIPSTTPDIKVDVSQEVLDNLTLSNNKFAVKLFKEVYKDQSSKNIVISPYSASMALAMTYNGAGGQTSTDMAKTLEWSDFTTKELNEAFYYQFKELENLDAKVPLNIANSIWYKNTYPFKQDFLNTNTTYYESEVIPADFNSAHTVDRINEWADENTNHKIPEIISEIDPASIMFLINAIHFKGTWTAEFSPQSTENAQFFLGEGETADCELMGQQSDFNYTENDFMQMVEMPYGDKKYSMILLLPKHGKTNLDIVNNLSVDELNNWIESFEEKEVQIRLPRFKTEYEIVLNEPLINLSMGSAFMGANFSGMADASNIAISQVKQNAFIEVNEEGTEAAAVTIVDIYTTSMPAFPIMMANKPFIYIIRDVENNNLLFMGQLANPAE